MSFHAILEYAKIALFELGGAVRSRGEFAVLGEPQLVSARFFLGRNADNGWGSGLAAPRDWETRANGSYVPIDRLEAS